MNVDMSVNMSVNETPFNTNRLKTKPFTNSHVLKLHNHINKLRFITPILSNTLQLNICVRDAEAGGSSPLTPTMVLSLDIKVLRNHWGFSHSWHLV